jgi:predicted transcriptional regulator
MDNLPMPILAAEPRRAATLPADRFDAAFDRAFSLVAFIMNRHLVDHMLRSARSFGIDFETMTIWAVLAHQNVAHLMPPGSMPTAMLNDRGRLPDERASGLRPVRLRDLSQITGIPRETVRRKLEVLAAAGWLLKTDDGWLLNRDKGEAELREFSRETARRFLAAAADVERCLREVDAGAPAPPPR